MTNAEEKESQLEALIGETASWQGNMQKYEMHILYIEVSDIP